MPTDSFEALPVDDLLAQLRDTPPAFVVKKDDKSDAIVPIVSATPPPKEEELGDYIIQKTTALVDQTMNAFKDIKDIAVATNDADTISALADVVKSVGSSLELLNKIHLQNKKTKAAKEVAQISADAKKKALENQPGTTNILAIGSREEVLKMLAEASKRATVVDIEATQVTTSNGTVVNIDKSLPPA